MLSIFTRLRMPVILIAALLWTALPMGASPTETALSSSDETAERLQSGQVVVQLKKKEDLNYVEGKVLINQPPSRVWPIMTNPFEFEGKISPRMTQVQVMVDKIDLSLLKCKVHIGFFIPDITYVVESRYEPVERISFKRTAGDLKDFRGEWEVRPACGGSKTELTYSMFIDPGIPVPQWIIREGVKSELPRILNGLRDRVNAIYTQNEAPEARSILAAGNLGKTVLLPVSSQLP